MPSLLNDGVTLKAGLYFIMVDPVWDRSADTDHDYKKVYIDIYAPFEVPIKEIEKDEGRALIAAAYSHHAQTRDYEMDE